ncbi:hypothetical protein D3C72_1500300 [compost metagenome]
MSASSSARSGRSTKQETGSDDGSCNVGMYRRRASSRCSTSASSSSALSRRSAPLGPRVSRPLSLARVRRTLEAEIRIWRLGSAVMRGDSSSPSQAASKPLAERMPSGRQRAQGAGVTAGCSLPLPRSNCQRLPCSCHACSAPCKRGCQSASSINSSMLPPATAERRSITGC